jgi:hypothetical protein
MDEYVGCMIEKLETGGIKFWQKVLLQSYRDVFNIGSMKKFNTPAAPGAVLKKPEEGKEILLPAKQTQYRLGVGKGLHMMQYSWPNRYNTVCNLARYMTLAMQVHYDTMLRMMKYVDDTSDSRVQCRSLLHYLFVRQSRQQEYYVLKTCYMFGMFLNQLDSR